MTDPYPGWTRTTITLALNTGTRYPVVVEAMGYFACHAPYDWDGRLPCPVQITHIPTGWMVGTARHEGDAKRAVQDLVGAADWSFTDPAAAPALSSLNPIFDRYSINTISKTRWH